MPLTLEFAAKKRKKKTKNCSKGYNCGNSCINKGRNCKKKFSNQASTYAGWLKKQARGNKPNVASKTVSSSWSDRNSKLDKLSKDKAVKLIVKHTVDGQLDSELRTSVAELIDRSKKKVIADIGKEVTGTVEKAGMSATMKRKRDGKTVVNPEYLNLTDDLGREVVKNQKSQSIKVEGFLDNLIRSNDPTKSTSQKSLAELRSQKNELGLSVKDVAKKLRNKILNQSVTYENLGRDGKNTYDDNKKDLTTSGLIATSKKKIEERIDYLLSDRRITSASSRSIDVINGYRAFIKDYDKIAQKSRSFSESVSKGDTVTWKWGTGKANGKVLAVYTKSVTRKLGGSEIKRNGSKDNPAYLIGQNDGSKILKLQSELIAD